jgi:hypothetical protein
MDVERNPFHIRNWKKKQNIYFSTYPPPTMITRVETGSTEVFWLLCQPLPHLRFNLFVISKTFLDPGVNHFMRTNTSHRNQEIFFMNILCIQSFYPRKEHTTKSCSSVVYILKHGRYFDYRNQPMNMSMRACYLYFFIVGKKIIINKKKRRRQCACASATYTVMKLDCAAT